MGSVLAVVHGPATPLTTTMAPLNKTILLTWPCLRKQRLPLLIQREFVPVKGKADGGDRVR